MKKKINLKTKDSAIRTIINRHADEDRYYEIIFVIHPECEVNQTTQNVIKKYVELFKTIEYKEQMGLRNLAYKIKKQITGFYFYMHVVCKLVDIDDFKKVIKRDQDILRYMIIRHKWNYEKLKALMTPKVQPSAKAKEDQEDFPPNDIEKKTISPKTTDKNDAKTSDHPSADVKKPVTVKTADVTADDSAAKNDAKNDAKKSDEKLPTKALSEDK